MTHADVADQLEAFVREQFGIPANDPKFGREVRLFERGYVDSIGVAEMLAFIEETFGVTVPDDDLLSDDFTTVDGIARIVRRLRSAEEASGRPGAATF